MNSLFPGGREPDWSTVPTPQYKADIRDYVMHGVLPSNPFLENLLRGNFVSAAEVAWPNALDKYGELVLWLARNVPHSCWGSYGDVNTWVHARSKGK